MWLTRLCQWLSTTYFLFPVACHLSTPTKLPELLSSPNLSLSYLPYQESLLSCHSFFILLAWPGKLPGNPGNLGFTSFDPPAAIDGSQASGRTKQSLSNQIGQSWSQPQSLRDSRSPSSRVPQKCSLYGSPFFCRILEVRGERQGKVESVPTRSPMINDAPNSSLRFSKQLCMAALECSISCPLGALAPPQSSGAPVCLHQGSFSHFPSVLPASHQRGRGGIALYPIIQLSFRKDMPQIPL